MLAAITRHSIAAPRWVIGLSAAVLVSAAVFGIPVVSSLSAGGFVDPRSESARASAIIADTFHQGDMQLVIVVGSRSGVVSGDARAVGVQIARKLRSSPWVSSVTSPWEQQPRPGMISADGTSALIIASLTGDEKTAPKNAQRIVDSLPTPGNGVTVGEGGSALVYSEITRQTQEDLVHMEAVAVPLSFFALVWVFGGLLAAAVPVAVGGFAIVGSLAVLRAIALVTDVSVFALNVAVALGFALAIDYTLLILSRYRQELSAGSSRDDALLHTMATAGRTVLFSATTVALALAGMAIFPMYFLRSFAYAGIAVLTFAAFAAVAIAPAAIVVIGDRLDAMDVRRLLRRIFGRDEPRPQAMERKFFYRMAKFVMRHAIPLGLMITAALLVLGTPFLRVNWGYPDDRVLPTSSSVRTINGMVRTDFGINSDAEIKIVLPDTHGLTDGDLSAYASRLSQVPAVTAVSAPTGTFVAGDRRGPPSAPTGLTGQSALLTVQSAAPLYTRESEHQLDRLHAVALLEHRRVLFSGTAQTNRDSVNAITSRLPAVLGFIVLVTGILLFLLTGSVVLPIKAVLLNILSLTATFGALVWIFQEGHIGAAGTTATGSLTVSIPVLMFCIAFGLSMDYEVFLLSRIREYWLASPQMGPDNDESIALGIGSTGRVVTAAALLMAIYFAALVFAGVSFMRMFAVGLTIAVLSDATVVRMILVPAFMHVLGRLNWWAPVPLARWHERRFSTGSARARDSVRV
ncbi:MAG TPA: MMPL family transporter [Mycobacterium sp.]|nr:MMPL family transporter [Mycobacterium sp.]